MILDSKRTAEWEYVPCGSLFLLFYGIFAVKLQPACNGSQVGIFWTENSVRYSSGSRFCRFGMRSIGKIPLLGHTSVNKYSVKTTLEIAELEYRKIWYNERKWARKLLADLWRTANGDHDSCVSSGKHRRCESWYNERRRKECGCEADIFFSCAINERTAMRSRAVERDSAGSWVDGWEYVHMIYMNT